MRIGEIRFCDSCRQSIPADTAWHEMPDGRELCLECWQYESAENRQLPLVQAPAPDAPHVCEMCGKPVAVGDFVIDMASGSKLCNACAAPPHSSSLAPANPPQIIVVNVPAAPEGPAPRRRRRLRRRPRKTRPRTVPIEKTGKFWKALWLLGVILFILSGGILFSIVMAAGGCEEMEREAPDPRLGVVGLIFVLSLVILLVSKIGAWWYHG